MQHPFRVLNVGAAALAMFVLPVPAFGAAQRTFVASYGSDVGPTAVLARVAVPQLQCGDRQHASGR